MTRRCGTSRRRAEVGAAAVETALVLPLLLFVLFAIIDLSRAYDTKIQLSQAAREGARLVAMQSSSNLTTRVQQAAPGLNITASGVTVAYLDSSGNVVSGGDCTNSSVVNARVTVTVNFTWVTGISSFARFFGTSSFPTPTTQSAQGVMQCA